MYKYLTSNVHLSKREPCVRLKKHLKVWNANFAHIHMCMKSICWKINLESLQLSLEHVAPSFQYNNKYKFNPSPSLHAINIQFIHFPRWKYAWWCILFPPANQRYIKNTPYLIILLIANGRAFGLRRIWQ